MRVLVEEACRLQHARHRLVAERSLPSDQEFAKLASNAAHFVRAALYLCADLRQFGLLSQPERNRPANGWAT